LLNNIEPSYDVRVVDLLIGEDLNWSDSLKKGLLKINEERVFFIYDDSFITKINIEEVEYVIKIAEDNDMDSVAFRKRSYGSGIRFNEKIYKIRSMAKYRNSLFLNLIKRDLIIMLLRSGENAWQFEKQGNVRSAKFNFYSVYNSPVDYLHGIIKGKWIPSTYKYLKVRGYGLEGNGFSSYSELRMHGIKVYVRLFTIAHQILHSLGRKFDL
jgi:hypothetical protein